jgi:prepilin-type N-terminal cleavage/methylation domain-containing protein
MLRHDVSTTTQRVRSARPLTGFTLIETIAAIVVLAIAIPPMLFAIRDSHVQRVGPVMASQARWLASEKLEDIIADRHSTTRGYDYLITSNYADETPVTGFTAFDRSVTFDETDADLSGAGTGYMIVTVDVSWTDATGDNRTLSLSTVLTELE